MFKHFPWETKKKKKKKKKKKTLKTAGILKNIALLLLNWSKHRGYLGQLSI